MSITETVSVHNDNELDTNTFMPPGTRTAPLACLECRHKHLKCDGIAPTCGRCYARNLKCNFMPSRRGRKRRAPEAGTGAEIARRRTTSSVNAEPAATIVASLSNSVDQTDDMLGTPPSIGQSNYTPRQAVSNDQRRHCSHSQDIGQYMHAHGPISIQDQTLSEATACPEYDNDETLINLYYLNFHLAHPILLPRASYADRKYAWYLRSVVEYVGSHYSQVITISKRSSLRDKALVQLAAADEDKVDLCQARLLLAIIDFARDDAQTGVKNLSHAIAVAVRLKMYKREFAATQGGRKSLEEESLRRTWWELYVTENYAAALQRKLPTDTMSAYMEVLLPCDEGHYENDVVPSDPSSWSDFENRVFSETDITFSSFAYRIKASQILAEVLTVTGPQGVHRDQVQAMDNALASWSLHLPDAKADTEIADTYGHFDMILFQAHVMIDHATILLHFPRGNINSSVVASAIVPSGHSTKSFCPCNRQNVHSVKATDASKNLTVLAAIRCSPSIHSPFNVYPLALSALVQLAVSKTHASDRSPCLEQHRARVVLVLGLLKRLSKHWPIAEASGRALRRRAAAVFRPDDEVTRAVDVGTSYEEGDPNSSFAQPHDDWLDSLTFQDLQQFAGLDVNAFYL